MNNNKIPPVIITMLISYLLMPFIWFATMGILVNSGLNEMCFPVTMGFVFVMSLCMLIGNHLTPEKSGTFGKITYTSFEHKGRDIAATVISFISFIILLIMYFSIDPVDRIAPIFVVFFISQAAIIVLCLVLRSNVPHPVHGNINPNAKNLTMITGVNPYNNNKQYFIDLHEDHMDYSEGDMTISLGYDEITLLELRQAKRSFAQKHNIRTYVNGVETTETKIPHKLTLHFIHNDSITEKTLTIEDDSIPAYKALVARREQLLSDY